MESLAGYFGIKLIVINMYVLIYINSETHYSDYSMESYFMYCPRAAGVTKNIFF